MPMNSWPSTWYVHIDAPARFVLVLSASSTAVVDMRWGWLPFAMQTMPLPTVNPQVMARAVWRETLRVFNVENQQAFIGSPAMNLISGGMAVLNMSDAQIIASPAQDTRLISTQPFTLQNARLIAAGWFSLNNKIYVGLVLLLGLILAVATSLFVRNVGRRQ